MEGGALFERVICINLVDRLDRLRRMRAVFASLPAALAEGVRFYRPDRDPRGGQLGCFESHVAVVRDAYDAGCANVLVFEDDVIPTLAAYDVEVARSVSLAFINSAHAEYLQLGYSILPHEVAAYATADRLGEHLVRFNGNLAHAYSLTRTGMAAVLENAPHATNDYDVFLKELFASRRGTGCAAVPQLFVQDFCDVSDNSQATTPYYSAMRSMACMSTRTDAFFRASVLRHRATQTIAALAVAIGFALALAAAAADRGRGLGRGGSRVNARAGGDRIGV